MWSSIPWTLWGWWVCPLLTRLSPEAHPFLLVGEKECEGQALKNWAGWAAFLLPSGVVYHVEVCSVLPKDPFGHHNRWQPVGQGASTHLFSVRTTEMRSKLCMRLIKLRGDGLYLAAVLMEWIVRVFRGLRVFHRAKGESSQRLLEISWGRAPKRCVLSTRKFLCAPLTFCGIDTMSHGWPREGSNCTASRRPVWASLPPAP